MDNFHEGIGCGLTGNKKYTWWRSLENTWEARVMVKGPLRLLQHELMKSRIRSVKVEKGRWDSQGVEKN